MTKERTRANMTKQEFEKVLEIINKNMTTLPDYMTNFPRVVLTDRGLSKVKEEMRGLINE